MNAPELLPPEAAEPSRSPDDFPDIGDYAAIGNCRTLALVSKNGAIEWLCLPHFSGPSIFGAILDRGAGHFSVQPAGDFTVERAYIPCTNVLVTTFHVDGGTLRVTDCMTLPPEPSASELVRAKRQLSPRRPRPHGPVLDRLFGPKRIALPASSGRTNRFRPGTTTDVT